MPNHIHLIWQIQDQHVKHKVQQSFLKFTAQKIKFHLIDTSDTSLENYKVKASDREYQFWERKPLSIDLLSHMYLCRSLLTYIHNNPTQPHWKLCKFPEEYSIPHSDFTSL